jgi:hypothetical protein
VFEIDPDPVEPDIAEHLDQHRVCRFGGDTEQHLLTFETDLQIVGLIHGHTGGETGVTNSFVTPWTHDQP